MKRVFLIVTVLALAFSSCKTSKSVSHSAYQPAIEKNVPQEEPQQPVAEEKPVVQEPEKPIVVKTEEVTIDKSTDQKLYPFYVVIGSFSMSENAYTLLDQQMTKGEKASVLKSESGMLRVACLGTASEQEARNKIEQIRAGNEFPDVWLLKTK